MDVVKDVDTDGVDERDPTWEEAVATQAAATPVKVVRPKRHVTVVYRYESGVFTATSPQLRSLRVSGSTLQEARSLARQDLERFLDPAVDVLEVTPPADPQICTVATGRGWFHASSLLIVEPSTSSSSRTFVSSSRRSRKVRA